MSDARKTTDHEEIRHWIEERGGQPASVRGTARGGAGILRVDFPGYGEDENLEPLDWEEFFDKFDEEDLAFLYQEETKDGDMSRFCKFVSRSQ